jgi:hypothetical protein
LLVPGVPWTRHDQYRKKAAEAQRQADRAVSDLDRARWLQLVHAKRRQTKQQAVADKGTPGKTKSKSSN